MELKFALTKMSLSFTLLELKCLSRGMNYIESTTFFELVTMENVHWSRTLQQNRLRNQTPKGHNKIGTPDAPHCFELKIDELKWRLAQISACLLVALSLQQQVNLKTHTNRGRQDAF